MTTAQWAIFLIYTILFEALVWIGGMYVILVYNWSPWWVAFLLLLSASQIMPNRIKVQSPNRETDHGK